MIGVRRIGGRTTRLVRVATVLALLGVLGTAAACTSSSSPAPASSSALPSSSSAPGPTAPSSPSGTPIATGPTTAAKAQSCPFVGTEFVHQTIGVRLGRLTVLRSGGKVVGCRFYALQTGFLHKTERLPGPNQPVLEITTQRYSTAVAAHNAFVRVAEQGTNPTQVSLDTGTTGVCFQDDFDPSDHGDDWSCAVNASTTALVVRSVDVTGTFNTAAVTRTVLRAL